MFVTHILNTYVNINLPSTWNMDRKKDFFIFFLEITWNGIFTLLLPTLNLLLLLPFVQFSLQNEKSKELNKNYVNLRHSALFCYKKKTCIHNSLFKLFCTVIYNYYQEKKRRRRRKEKSWTQLYSESTTRRTKNYSSCSSVVFILVYTSLDIGLLLTCFLGHVKVKVKKRTNRRNFYLCVFCDWFVS